MFLSIVKCVVNSRPDAEPHKRDVHFTKEEKSNRKETKGRSDLIVGPDV